MRCGQGRFGRMSAQMTAATASRPSPNMRKNGSGGEAGWSRGARFGLAMSQAWPFSSELERDKVRSARASIARVCRPRPRVCLRQDHARCGLARLARATLKIGRAPRPEWSYWQPVDLTLRPLAERESPLSFPLQESDVAGLPTGADATTLREDGLVVSAAKSTRFAGAYRELAARGVPVLVTADSLYYATHLALDRALDDVERGGLSTDLQLVLDKSYVRLSTEALTSPPDLVASYRLARAVLGVALVLLDAKTHQVPPDLQAIVAAEVGLVRKHVGLAQSPLFGFTLDYGALAPEGAASTPGALTGAHLALSWLAAAPFAIAARSEVRESPVSVAKARDAVRAALLLANVTDPQNDRVLAGSYERFRAALRFELGPSDDTSLAELAKTAEGVGVTVSDRRTFSSPVRADKVRHALFAKHEVQIYDGVFGLAVPSKASSATLGRSASSVRMFGSYASVDSGVLAELLFPRVGKRPAGAAHPRAWQGLRVLPSTLDLLAWMGSASARAQLQAAGDSAFDGFDAALVRAGSLYSTADSPRAHSSLYDSWLDATISIVQKSYADEAEPAFERPSYAVRKAELAACAWALGRHDAEPFGRALAAAVTPAPTPPPVGEVYIESNPESYARLLGLVRQAQRGLAAMALTPKTPAGLSALREIDGVLEVAIAASAAVVNGSANPESLTALPARLVAFEERYGTSDAGSPYVVADVHADANSNRVLHVGTGPIRELALLMTRHGTDSGLIVARGPVLSFREHVQDAKERLDDVAWRQLLNTGSLRAEAPFDR